MRELNPLEWPAEPFLLLFTLVAGGALLLLWLERTRLGDPAPGRGTEEFGPLHLAYLAGGESRAADAALVGLLEARAAVADRKRGLIRFDPAVPVPEVLRPFRDGVAGEGSRAGFKQFFAASWRGLHDDLLRRGLVPGPAEVARFRARGWPMLAVPLLFGAAKVAVGVSRDRPVGILCVLLVLTAVLGILALTEPPSRNLAGATALAAARERNARAARAPLPEEMVLAFALTGPAVLAGRDYRWVITPDSTTADGGSSGGGDGGGCGGCSA